MIRGRTHKICLFPNFYERVKLFLGTGENRNWIWNFNLKLIAAGRPVSDAHCLLSLGALKYRSSS